MQRPAMRRNEHGRRRMRAAGSLIALCSLLAACGELTEGGPTADAIRAEASATLAYRLVPITAATLVAVAAGEPDRLAGAFRDDRPPAPLVLGIGDILSIAIYEAAVGGLFLPGDSGARPGNYVSLPDQTVDLAGDVSFPYGGAIRAAGRTPQQLQQAILARIKTRAIDPQVIVTVVMQQTSLVSVEGEVRRPDRYPAAAPGARDRITDAITRAGGLADAGWDSWVSLERDGRRATVPFEALLTAPADDIFVRPGDRILVYREPQRFVAFGAVSGRAPRDVADAAAVGTLLDGGRPVIPFGNWRLSLAEAVAKAGGLFDARADAGSVFLYRREPAVVARRLGLDPGPLTVVPVIYRLDLSDPAGFLLATRFPMRNGDLLFVANARSVEVTKAVGAFGAYLSTATDAATAALVTRSAAGGSGSTGLTTVGGLAVVPAGVTGQPGTITIGKLANGVAATPATATGGTQDSAGTGAAGGTGAAAAPAADAATAAATTRSTMTSPASR